MMDTKAFTGAMAGVGLSMTGFALSVTEITAILSLCSTALGLIIMVVTAIIIPLWKWYKKAKEDGKIDPEEVEEAIKVIETGAEQVKPAVKDAVEKVEDLAKKD